MLKKTYIDVSSKGPSPDHRHRTVLYLAVAYADPTSFHIFLQFWLVQQHSNYCSLFLFQVLVKFVFVLYCTVGPDGTPYVGTTLTHEAIPRDDIIRLYDLMNQSDGTKLQFDDAVHILKRTLFPSNYDPYPWIAGIHDYYFI